MNTSRRLPLMGWLGLGILSFLVSILLLVTIFSVIVTFLMTLGTGNGSGAGSCGPGQNAAQVTPTAKAATTVVATPTPTPACLSPGAIGAAVVQLAAQMADALTVNPACGGTISFPNCYYTWYTSAFPPSVIAYGEQVCPGCLSWSNGDYQCVSFVRGAYSQVYPMTLTANAFDLWATYQGQQGWSEIPSAAAPPGQRGMPLPGDVMVFKDTSVGHAAIVMQVVPPTATNNGSIEFANANSVSPYTTMPLLPDLTVDTSSWPSYTVWGYLRPHVENVASHALVRISQLDPAQYASSQEYQTWAYSACSAAALTEVFNAYGRHDRIHDILTVEAARGDITPQLGLVSSSGIADTATQFGFRTSWATSGQTLDQLIATATSGLPVIVGFPPDRYAGGHILVVIGGNPTSVLVADSSAHNYHVLSRSQFLQWWGGFYAVVTPQ